AYAQRPAHQLAVTGPLIVLQTPVAGLFRLVERKRLALGGGRSALGLVLRQSGLPEDDQPAAEDDGQRSRQAHCLAPRNGQAPRRARFTEDDVIGLNGFEPPAALLLANQQKA